MQTVLTNLPSFLTPALFVWGIVAIAIVFFVAISLMFLYHWMKYADGLITIANALILYFGVSLILLILILAFASRIL